MKLIWATDLHLNHVPLDAWDRWIGQITSHSAEGLLITGDISEGDDVVFQLKRLAEVIEIPIWFVLGNHDFYQSSIGATRRNVIDASREISSLLYLTDTSALRLADEIYLVGEDGWGDATEGDYERSPIRLNDFPLISDFSRQPPSDWKQHLQTLGRESADRLESKLLELPATARQVLVLTHVPPFRESCWYQGQTTDDFWAPFFVCGEVGHVLRRFSESRPDCLVTVLCGHTHHRGVANVAVNLVVHTGAAEYGCPEMEATIEISAGSITVKRWKAT